MITLYLDKKEGWGHSGNGRQPADLDRLLEQELGVAKLYTPRMLRGGSPSLRAAATIDNWSPVSDLRGQITVVITGGVKGRRNEHLRRYVNDRRDSAVAFVTALVDEVEDVTGIPDGFDPKSAQHVVFYNLESGTEGLAPLIRARNYVSRAWGIDDKELCELAGLCVNHSAYYRWTRDCDGKAAGALVWRPCR